MTARSAFRLGQGIGGLVAIAIVIACFAYDDFLRLTADEQNRDAILWIYDRDAAPGQTLDGEVMVERGDIQHVEVYRWFDRDQPDMHVDALGDVWIPERQAGSSQGFSFTVPSGAAPGETLDLEIEVHRTSGAPIELTRRLTLMSRGASTLIRIGKGALAIALLAALTAMVFLIKRRALLHSSQESPLWLVPAVVIGGLTFVPLVEQATRLHGGWFYGTALAGWAMASFGLAERLNRRMGLVAYAAVPLLVEMRSQDAFRGASVSTPIRPVGDLENAWAAIGLVVRRAGRDLIVTGPGKRIAVVPVPASEVVGTGPLVVRASDPEFADLLIAAASDVLGELRVE